MHYTVGFVFDKNLQKVLLVHKLSPPWQKGKLNGLGGKKEFGEKSIDCIVREVKEEASVTISKKNWIYIGRIQEGESLVDFYITKTNHPHNFKSVEKEKVEWFNLKELPANIMPNLTWLIPFAVDKFRNSNLKNFTVNYEKDEDRMEISIIPINSTHKKYILETAQRYWGSTDVVVHSHKFNLTALPGFIAELNTKPVGLILFKSQPKRAEIVALASDVTKKGIGKALVEELKKYLKSKGCKKISVTTTNDNLDALIFYQKIGFNITEIRLDALKDSRKLKPQIPKFGAYGIPLRDEIDLETFI